MKASVATPKTLLTRFLLVTAAVILLIFFSQYLVNHSFQNLKQDEQLIEAVGEQQKTTLFITQEMTADQLQGIEMTMSLDSLRKQLRLVQLNRLTGSDGGNSVYAKACQDLSESYIAFCNALDTSLNRDGMTGYVNLVVAQNNYLVDLDKYAAAVTSNSNTKIRQFRRIQIITMWITITAVGLSAIFVFLPVIKKIEQQNERLKKIIHNQSHIVRRPLANIKLFLNLIQMAPDKDSVELLQHIQTETEELDTIIRSSVKQTEELF